MNTSLVLFFTRGVSLRTWSMVGMLKREVALYRYLMGHGFDVSFLTYGDVSDRDYANQLGGIHILCNEKGIPPHIYENRLLSIHGNVLNTAHIIKTNQTYGADTALWAARFFRKPLVARCGYMWSANAAREHGNESLQAVQARMVEEKVFSAADRVVVTTEAMKKDVERRIPEAGGKISVIPNYVDTDTFKPVAVHKDFNTILFVGRIAPEKNLGALLEAVSTLDAKLILIGEGKLRPELQQRFSGLGERVVWEGNVPNSELPGYFNRVGLFVLPSLYEGHPKALIEAMACGMTVLGADSPGIRDVITHGVTGYLCRTDPADIRNAITYLMKNPDVCAELGRNARTYVRDNYSLGQIGGMELSLLNSLRKGKSDDSIK